MEKAAAKHVIEQAVILVGGSGTRLGERTRDTPKPLLDVGGRPFLGWLIDELRRFGIADILLLAGFHGERFGEIFSSSTDVQTVVEPTPLGTAGALRFAADRLTDRFFVLNGDSLFDINLWDLARAAPEAEAILALREVADASRYETVRMEGERIIGVSPRISVPRPGLINAGVGVFAKRIVERIPSGTAASIERDVYPLIAAGGNLFGRIYEAAFIDIGVPDDFERAQAFVPAQLRRGMVLFGRDMLSTSGSHSSLSAPASWRTGAVEAVKAVNDAGLLAVLLVESLADRDNAEATRVAANMTMKPSGAHFDAIIPTTASISDTAERIGALASRLYVDRDQVVMIARNPRDLAVAGRLGLRTASPAGPLMQAVALEVLELRASRPPPARD